MKWKIIYLSLLALTYLALTSCTPKKSVKSDHVDHVAVDAGGMSNMIHLSETEEEYANITIDTVRQKLISEYTTLLGITTLDERTFTVLTSRANGRVDKLFVRNPQQAVEVGQPLYSIYSEQLLSDENEFLSALSEETQSGITKEIVDELVAGTKRKLLLWGLSMEQIHDLEKSKTASPLVTYHSPVSGILIEVPINEGQYVDMGTPLFKVASLSKLWVEAQMYPDELKWLYENPRIMIEFDGYPNEVFFASPVFDNPTVEPDQKVSLVRFALENRQLKFKPGMMAYVNIQRKEKRGLVIPKSSILLGSMVTVWVKTGAGMYESRMIELGIQNKKEVEVTKGLTEGEQIVTSGAYLLNSAWIIKKGTGMPGMEGMKM